MGLTDLGSLPFHCPNCQEELQRAGVTDITLDHNVMYTVVRGGAPAVNPDELARCERVARWFFWDGSNLRLRDSAERLVVPLCRRAAMVSETARDLGFPGGDRLYQLLKQCHWWRGMRMDCLLVARSQHPSQVENQPCFRQPLLTPTQKTRGPFKVWCIDLVTHLQLLGMVSFCCV